MPAGHSADAVCILYGRSGIDRRLVGALEKQGLTCPTAIDIESATPEVVESLKGFQGVLLVDSPTVDEWHCQLAKRLRDTVGADAIIAFVAPASQSVGILRAIRFGANEGLCIDGHLDSDLFDLLDRVCRNRRRTGVSQCLAVVPCFADLDADLLSVNLATVVAQDTGRCGLLDLRLAGGNLALLLQVEPRHTVDDLMTEWQVLDTPMLKQAVVRHEIGVELVAAPPWTSSAPPVAEDAIDKLLSLAREEWEILLVNADLPRAADDAAALRDASLIVVAIRLDIATVRRAHFAIETMARGGIARERIVVVAVATGHSGELELSATKKVLQVETIHCIPDDPPAFLRSFNVGTPLVRECPTSKATAAIHRIAESVVGVGGAGQKPSTASLLAPVSSLFSIAGLSPGQGR